jgi:hypothetical protein
MPLMMVMPSDWDIYLNFKRNRNVDVVTAGVVPCDYFIVLLVIVLFLS